MYKFRYVEWEREIVIENGVGKFGGGKLRVELGMYGIVLEFSRWKYIGC